MVIIKDGVLHAVPVGERTQRAPHTPSVARRMAPTALARRVLQGGERYGRACCCASFAACSRRCITTSQAEEEAVDLQRENKRLRLENAALREEASHRIAPLSYEVLTSGKLNCQGNIRGVPGIRRVASWCAGGVGGNVRGSWDGGGMEGLCAC